MNQFLSKFPKSLIAFVAIAFGIFVIIANDPPKDICDAQLEVFIAELRPLLSANPNSPVEVAKTAFDRLFEQCKYANGPGGCFEFFLQIRKILSALDRVPNKCLSEIGELPPVNKSVWLTLELIIKLAWGNEAPQGYYQKMGWLGHSDVNLFCKLKDRANLIYGTERWQSFQEAMFNSLPGADKLSRESVWNSSILSLSCSSFM